jgi:hypothetical protein
MTTSSAPADTTPAESRPALSAAFAPGPGQRLFFVPALVVPAVGTVKLCRERP